MVNFKLFFELLSVNLTNVFQNLGDVVECATKEGAYCANVISKDKEGNNKYLVVEFEETASPAWDYWNIVQTSMKPISEDEFAELVLEAVAGFIELTPLNK